MSSLKLLHVTTNKALVKSRKHELSGVGIGYLFCPFTNDEKLIKYGIKIYQY